jgi:hypothetical protein
MSGPRDAGIPISYVFILIRHTILFPRGLGPVNTFAGYPVGIRTFDVSPGGPGRT